ncbi:MAG: PAS domain-containing protein [Actinobacteria bacterium]|uniref:histidine kinase n=1 Tax=freshwater metagenome TaxID=449393 RepID=A0A6J7I9B0_9ZZZZ|nr:PAS domain-containing protein [Actinomycetota bacterium]MSW40606.1 PAS domain-containing protein [Actinomycetota bacterium]
MTSLIGLAGLARDRTELSDDDAAHLQAVVADWGLLADLGFSDLVLWVPTWNEGGCVAVAQVRPTTGATSLPDDVVGQFAPKGEWPCVDRALVSRQSVLVRAEDQPRVPLGVEAIPVVREGRVLGVMGRHAAAFSRRLGVSGIGAEVVLGELEQVYLRSFDDLAAMLAAGEFPYVERIGVSTAPPRVGDGVLRLDTAGRVEFASPNAVSAFHRLGLAVDLQGASLASVVSRLKTRPGTSDESLSVVAAGVAAGEAEIDGGAAVVTLRGLPLRSAGQQPEGSLVLVRDVTDLRRRDRALLTKDATIREIHHRVKNNLQTVASLLRLQSRRMPQGEAREALDEAVRRVGAIAVVHEVLALAPGQLVDFDDVTDRVVALAADAAGAQGGVVQREGSVGQWPTERATPLAMALTELLMNAVEHGLGGGSGHLVSVTAVRSDDAVTLVVSDDGPGFSSTLDESATGLGLHIVRTLVVEDLGGTLDLGHVGGPGSVVTIRVPVS